MKKNTRFYVSRKNVLTWLVALCMVCSAVARIVFVGVKGADSTLTVWSQIVLPIAAALLFALLILVSGKEHFYRTAIPVWLMCAYYVFYFNNFAFGGYHGLMVTVFGVALLFIAIFYTQISCGKVPLTSLIVPLMAAPLGAQLYLQRALLTGSAFTVLLPDMLMMGSCMLLVFAIGIHPAGEYHPTWGDRSDGRLLRTMPAMSQVSPYIMPTRNESHNMFSQSIEITHTERYIRQKRREGLSNFGLIHVFLAAYCRALCKYPALNRFISGQKIYSRDEDVVFFMTIKKEMSTESPDTVIKVHLSPRDTAEDIYHKINAEIEQVKKSPADSDFDSTAQILAYIPGFLLRFVVWLLRVLDYCGLVPKFLLEVSPFHGSVCYTSLGSLGIPPVYHHLYNFGNLPCFCAFGCKRRELKVQEDGSIIQYKYVDCNFTVDERTVDGFYYAAFIKHYTRLVMRPEVMDEPPTEVLRDID